MLTEFMAGLDLGRLIAKGPTYPTYRTEVTAQKIAKKILESVAIMHSHKIVHQDLKPGVRISFPSSCVPCYLADRERIIEHPSGRRES